MLFKFTVGGIKKLPVILQIEASECALACLAMISGYWGHNIDVAFLRQHFSVSLRGTSLKSVIDIAAHLNLRARPLKLGMKRLGDLSVPCILHWNINHLVVLKYVAKNHIIIHDPAVGVRRVSIDDTSQYFSGIAIELEPADNFKLGRHEKRFTLISLMGRVVGLKSNILYLIFLGLTLQLCALLSPFFLRWVVDYVLVSNNMDMLNILGLCFLLLLIFQVFISFVRSWTSATISNSLNFQWLSNIFSHLLTLPISYFERRHLGDIVSRFGSVQIIQRGISIQFIEAVMDGFLIFISLFVMFWYSFKLTFLALLVVSIYAAIRAIVFRNFKEANSEQIIHFSRQQTIFIESARGIQSIRLFNRMEERRINWTNVLVEQLNSELKISRIKILYESSRYFLFGVERILIIWLGGISIAERRGGVTIGILLAFIAYNEQFTDRVSSLIDKFLEFKLLHLHGDRVSDIVHTASERREMVSGVHLSNGPHSIEIKELTFRYGQGEFKAICSVDLYIPIGQCIAITGPSGGGKTTLVKLLLGLLTPSSGDIIIGGVSIFDVNLNGYRDLIGTVMQEDYLFAGSILDNICFFDSSPDRAWVIECAKLSAIHNEIMQMPMGYESPVGDIGTGLSGGQKQRILLARAMYKRPSILVFDEATSHLDIESERVVNHAISKMSLTRIIIAHRADTIAMADRVVEVVMGKIVADRLNPSGFQNVAVDINHGAGLRVELK